MCAIEPQTMNGGLGCIHIQIQTPERNSIVNNISMCAHSITQCQPWPHVVRQANSFMGSSGLHTISRLLQPIHIFITRAVDLPTSSSKHAGGPLANKGQLQPADPASSSQPRALQQACNKPCSPPDFQMSAKMKGDDPISLQPVNTNPSLEAQALPAPSSFQTPPPKSSIPNVEIPIHLPVWVPFSQQTLLVPPTHLDKQLSQRTQQAAVATICSKTLDSNLFHQNINRASCVCVCVCVYIYIYIYITYQCLCLLARIKQVQFYTHLRCLFQLDNDAYSIFK